MKTLLNRHTFLDEGHLLKVQSLHHYTVKIFKKNSCKRQVTIIIMIKNTENYIVEVGRPINAERYFGLRFIEVYCHIKFKFKKPMERIQ